MESNAEIAYMGLQDYMIPCATKQILGFDCPGCGLQRSVLLLLQGDFLAAFYMFPAIYPLLALVTVLVFNQITSIKHYQKLVIVFSISTVVAILINFIFKLIN